MNKYDNSHLPLVFMKHMETSLAKVLWKPCVYVVKSKIGMEEKMLKSQMRTTEKNKRVLVKMRLAFSGEAMANALSIDMATMVNMDACAIVFSNHGINLHKK